MKLSEWARKQGISYVTAFNWFKSGKLPVRAIQTVSRTILIQEEELNNIVPKTVVYGRVSSHNKKEDLSRQINRCLEFCVAKGWQVDKIFKEIASGMNDKRPQLLKVFEYNPTRIVIEHKDRLTRFGFNYLSYFLSKRQCEIVVLNPAEEYKEDLVKDLISIITSFCCKIYGLRRSKNKIKQVKQAIL
jgi:putative resolvase